MTLVAHWRERINSSASSGEAHSARPLARLTRCPHVQSLPAPPPPPRAPCVGVGAVPSPAPGTYNWGVGGAARGAPKGFLERKPGLSLGCPRERCLVRQSSKHELSRAWGRSH